jgi:signal transduction histidine kinase
MQIDQAAAPQYLSPTRGWRRWLGWALCGLAIALAAFGVALRLGRGDFRDLLGAAYAITCALTGALIVSRRQRNLVGWLLLVVGVCVTGGFAALQYGVYGVVVAPGSLPWPREVAWLASFLLPFGTGLLVAVLPLVFPNGALLSRAWRRAAWLVGVTMVALVAVNMRRPGRIQDVPGLINPFALPLPAPWEPALDAASGFLALATFLVSAASVVVRYRRAGRDERLQMKWLTYAILLWGASVIFASFVEAIDPALFPLADTLVFVALVFIPASIGIAVLRYRLYDIDLLLSRTLVYGVLTTGVVGLYALVVTGLGALLAARGSLLISLFATGLIAVLFQPLRVRLQRGVNRLVYGARDEPYTALARLGQRLEATIAPEAVLPTLVQTVAEALRLPYVALALDTRHGDREARRRSDSSEAAVSFGVLPASLSHDQLVSLPLAFQGEAVGQLLLAPRAPGEPFSAADERLLRDLARQAGASVHAVRLTAALEARMAELRRSRERLVTAQEEERRRIQRDLHDGLGPVLASMRFRLEACLAQAPDDAPGLVADLERLDALVGQASTDIRRLVHDLRPPALDQVGLVAALRQHVERVRRETALDVRLDVAPLPALAAAAEVTIYRAVQEALVNIHKHARATVATIELGPLGAALLLRVHDDGAGGALVGRHAAGGHGLAGMRERAELIGGTLVVHSAPGAGTTLELYLPIREEANGDQSAN